MTSGRLRSNVDHALPAGGNFVAYGYKNQAETMEAAKAGALFYINSLINMGEGGTQTLLQYRMDRYKDLNVNLVESNIYQVKNNLLDASDQHRL